TVLHADNFGLKDGVASLFNHFVAGDGARTVVGYAHFCTAFDFLGHGFARVNLLFGDERYNALLPACHVVSLCEGATGHCNCETQNCPLQSASVEHSAKHYLVPFATYWRFGRILFFWQVAPEIYPPALCACSLNLCPTLRNRTDQEVTGEKRQHRF